MARIDDYIKALEIAKQELRNRNPLHVCRLSGSQCIEEAGKLTGIRLAFLNRIITISWPDLEFYQESSKEDIPIKHKILILHYLNGSLKDDITGEWISYKDIPSAKFYIDAFNRRAKNPLVDTFGEQPDKLLPIAKELFGATQSPLGDVSVRIQAFPKVPISLIIWEGDEEFSSDGTIVFDSSIKAILSAEDISELTSQIVYTLVAKVK